MSNRNVLVLGALAVALLAFIVAFERGTLSTGELAGREERLLPRFARDRVTEIAISDPARGTEVVLRRDPIAGDDDELAEEPRWRLVAPLEALADEEAVASLLGVLEYSDARRRIDGVSASDRQTFGLEAPRVVLRLRVGSESSELRLGGEDPTGAGVYAALAGADAALVVGRDVLEALQHDADHFRSRALFPEGLGALRTIAIAHEGATRRLERADGRWWLREPTAMWASEARVRDVQRTLGELEATRFAGEGTELAAEPWLRVRAETSPESSGEETKAVELVVGAPCPEHEGERLARLDDGPTVCLSEDALVALRVSAEDLRELRAVTAQEGDIEAIVVERGARRLELHEAEGTWTATLVSGSDRRESAVDPDALSEWLQELRGLRASATRPADAANLRAAGISGASLRVQIDGRDDVADEVLVLGAARDGKVLARRGEEPVLLELPSSAVDVASVGPVRFRSRTLFEATDEAISAVRIERGSRIERVERAPVGFQVIEPVPVGADRVATRDLVARLAHLEAVDWVGEGADPRQGLGSPRYVVEVSLDPETEGGPPRTYRLRVGSPTEGGAYAQKDNDPAVFVLPSAVVELLASSLASRDLLATDVLHLDGLRIDDGASRIELTHDGVEFRTPQGPAAPDATRELTSRIASLRATRVESDAPTETRFGLAAPRARIEVRRDETSEPPRYTIRIGRTDGQGGVYAQREDLPLVFVLPAATVDAILAYRP